MIKHIVCFKLHDSPDEQKKAAKDILLSMTGKVPQIISIEVGTDFLGSPRSYDVILQVTLESREALDAYQADEYHCSVVKTYMHEHAVGSVALDYDI